MKAFEARKKVPKTLQINLIFEAMCCEKTSLCLAYTVLTTPILRQTTICNNLLAAEICHRVRSQANHGAHVARLLVKREPVKNAVYLVLNQV